MNRVLKTAKRRLPEGFAGGYRFGFNGHEKDDEIKSVGNHLSFNDYGYDPRTGKRWRIDPAFKEYPSIAPYAGFSNNPLIYIDPDGRIVKYANEETQKAVESAMARDPNFAKAIFKLINSDVIYNYTLTGIADYREAASSGAINPGGVSSDGSQINIAFQIIENSAVDGQYSSLYHETEHGLQFEHGELGFKKTENDQWVTDESYDINDEVKGFEAGMQAPGVDEIAKKNFEKKSVEQKIKYVGRQSEQYKTLQKKSEWDKSVGNPIDRNHNISSDGVQKTVKTEKRFYKTYKER